MSRRPKRPSRVPQFEPLEPRQLLSRGVRHPGVLPVHAAAEATDAPRPDLDAFARDLVGHPGRAARHGLGGLVREMNRHAGFAARHGWGACLAMELRTHPAYAAAHHLTALVSPAHPAPSALPASPTRVPVPRTGAAAAPSVAAASGPAATPPVTTATDALAGPVVSQTYLVAVGGTLDVTVPGGGLAGPGLTYTITPQPLPANMTFNRGTGALVFAPAPGQVGQYRFNVTVSDGTRSVTEAVPLAVVSTPRPSTEVSGRVVDVSGVPLAGVPVMIGHIEAVTDAAGRFTLKGVPDRPGPLAVDGLHAGGYLMPMAPVPQFLGHPLHPGVENVVAAPIALPRLDTAHATDFSRVDQGKGLDLTSPLMPGVTLHVAPGSAVGMDGKAFAGNLTLTDLPVSKLLEVMPPGIVPHALIGVDGPDLMFRTPAKLTLPNLSGDAPGSVHSLLSLNMQTGEFEVSGHVQVSADGKWLTTVDGGIHASTCACIFDPPAGQGGMNSSCGCPTTPGGVSPPMAGGPNPPPVRVMLGGSPK